MKRILFILLLIAAAVFSASCQKQEISERAMQAGREAIKAADSFIDKQSSANEAVEKLEKLSSDMEYIEISDKKTPDWDIDTYITQLSIYVSAVPEGSDEFGDVLDTRNELADFIGVERKSK